MKKWFPRLLIIIGIAVLLLAVGLKIYDLANDYSAGRNSQLLLEQMQQNTALSKTEEPVTDPSEEPSETQAQPELSYNVIGILEIPSLKLELPVLSECTPSLLKVSVCRYMGGAEDGAERLVVAGHNYKSHFGTISQLEIGAEVRFTGLSGVEYSYEVTEITVIAANDLKTLESGEWDIALFTCNFGGTKRILVRCQEITRDEA